jgi:hypothetical protein
MEEGQKPVDQEAPPPAGTTVEPDTNIEQAKNYSETGQGTVDDQRHIKEAEAHGAAQAELDQINNTSKEMAATGNAPQWLDKGASQVSPTQEVSPSGMSQPNTSINTDIDKQVAESNQKPSMTNKILRILGLKH